MRLGEIMLAVTKASQSNERARCRVDEEIETKNGCGARRWKGVVDGDGVEWHLIGRRIRDEWIGLDRGPELGGSTPRPLF